MRGDLRTLALGAAFFASGACALVYETVWGRWLGLALGADARGVAAVLAAFMAGFGIGGALAGRLAARSRAPARDYARIEASLAACGLLSPLLLPALQRAAPRLDFLAERAPFAYDAVRFAVAAGTLLLPAILLGATVPFMARLRVRPEDPGEGLARLYAANTVGAAFGAGASAFVLVPALGLAGSVRLAAVVNLAVAATVLAVAGRGAAGTAPRPAPPDAGRTRFDRAARWVLAAAALSGAASLASETILTRALVGVLGASTYAFACVLAAFLLGIGLGPRLFPTGGDRRAAVGRFAACQAASALGLCVGVLAIAHGLGVADFLGTARNRAPGVGRPGALFAYQFLVACAALVPAALFLGAAFPAAIRAALPDGGSAARASGAAYAWNTAGALAGTLLGAFVAIPRLGLRAGLAAAAAVNLVAAVVAIAAGAERAAARRALLLAGASLPVGAFALFPSSDDPPGVRTLFVEQGSSTTASVEESTDPLGARVRSLRLDGKVVATSGFLDMRLQRLLGVLPAFAATEAGPSLTVGLGTGTTAGATALAVAPHPSTVVEIAPPVARAAAFFARENAGVLGRSRLRLEDGRSYLLRTRQPFAVITTDPIHPWTAGSGSLYTREYFRLVRARLAPGGAAAQWIPLYEVSERDVRSVAATFAACFEQVALFVTGYDLVLVGRPEPIGFRLADLEAAFARRELRAALHEVGILDPADLLATFVAGDAAVRRFAADAPLNDDDRPWIEFAAPRSFLAGYTTGVLRWVVERHASEDEIPVDAGPSERLHLRQALDRRDAAIRVFLDRYGARPFPESFPDAVTGFVEALRRRA